MRRYGWQWAGRGAAFMLGAGLFACSTETVDQGTPVPTSETPGYLPMTTMAHYVQAMEELSNWGRWGPDDELGTANLITPAKRIAAAALVTEGISVSLSHDVMQEGDIDGRVVLTREVLNVNQSGASDRYQYTGTYHGTNHSHLDAVDCHIMYEGKGYNGVSMEEIEEAGGCPRGSINAVKDGIVTRDLWFPRLIRCFAWAGARSSRTNSTTAWTGRASAEASAICSPARSSVLLRATSTPLSATRPAKSDT